MPSLLHQFLSRLIFLWLNKHVEQNNLGIVMTAPTRVRIDVRHYREPDVLFVATQNIRRRHEQYWESIDLAVEIISPDDADRDLIDKRRDYAAAGVAEYWLVDPRDDSVTVLTLEDRAYKELHAKESNEASSRLLDGLRLDVASLFRSARES